MSSRFLVVIESGSGANCSAYVPDVLGCVVAADTVDECEALMRDALALHIESLHEHGEPIPHAESSAAYVEL